MPHFAFTKAGTVEIISFNMDTGEYELVDKAVCPGEVHEVTIDAIPALLESGFGFTPDTKKYQEKQEAFKRMTDAEDRETIRKEKIAERERTNKERDQKVQDRLEALENG